MEEKEKEIEETLEPEKEEGKKGKKERKLEERLEKAEAEAAHWKDQYYRMYADTSNLRKTLEEDHRNALKYRAEGFIEQLVPALDAFHSALNAPAPSKDAENYKIGFTYIYRQLVAALEGEGLKEIEPKIGDKFDARYMHAVDTVEAEEAGLVVKVLGKGYQLKDRLIRPVMVAVSVAKKEEKAPTLEEGKQNEEAHKA